MNAAYAGAAEIQSVHFPYIEKDTNLKSESLWWVSHNRECLILRSPKWKQLCKFFNVSYTKKRSHLKLACDCLPARKTTKVAGNQEQNINQNSPPL
eukprot:3342530-Amphidinium_carterae.1